MIRRISQNWVYDYAINILYLECKEKLDGLKQDWMILLSNIDELEKRKADLQIL